jgi:hypothetical protein
MVSDRRDVDDRHLLLQLRRDALVQLDVGLERRLHRAHERLDLDARRRRLDHPLELAEEERVVRHELRDLRARHALDEHLHRAVGQREQLHHLPQRGELEELVGRRVVGLGLLLSREQQPRLAVSALLRHRLLQRRDRLLATDIERANLVREEHDVAQGEHREHCFLLVVAAEEHVCAGL